MKKGGIILCSLVLPFMLFAYVTTTKAETIQESEVLGTEQSADVLEDVPASDNDGVSVPAQEETAKMGEKDLVVETEVDADIYEFNKDDTLLLIGRYHPSRKSGEPGTLVLGGMKQEKEEKEQPETEPETDPDLEITDKREKAPIVLDLDDANNLIIKVKYNPESSSYERFIGVAVNGVQGKEKIGDKQGYIKIDKISNLEKLFQTYFDSHCTEVDKKARYEEKQKIAEQIQSKQEKISIPTLLGLIEGTFISIAVLALGVMGLIARKKQKTNVAGINNRLEDIQKQLIRGKDSITEEIKESIKKIPSIIGNPARNEKIEPKPIDHVKEFLASVNKLTKKSNTNWGESLSEYNPKLVNYDGINGRFYRADEDEKPAFAVCDMHGTLVVIPSYYNTGLNNCNTSYVYKIISSENISTYKIDKPAEVVKEGELYFVLKQQGQISLI